MWPDTDFPADPYPGAVPPGSFVHSAAVARPLPDDLDRVLREHGRGRLPVLTYGSNRCPSKITWLREALGLGPDPVVVLRATTVGVAAVWAAGLRLRDGQRPATLAAEPGRVEEHAVWLATPGQVAVLDACEGRGTRHRLARLDTGTVTVAGTVVERPWVYLATGPERAPLLVDGLPVPCADVPQQRARTLAGRPAAGDGLAAPTVTGAPDPGAWPATLFTYGLLRPGDAAWPRVAPHATGPARPATVAGGMFDTGLGYPAWLPDARGATRGVLVPLADPAALLPALDAYEGPEYERIRVVVDGTVAWAYAWRAGHDGLTDHPEGWPAS